jgi:hypothetical protein
MHIKECKGIPKVQSHVKMERDLLFNVRSTDGTSGLDSPGTPVAEAVAARDHDFRLGSSEANGTFGVG